MEWLHTQSMVDSVSADAITEMLCAQYASCLISLSEWLSIFIGKRKEWNSRRKTLKVKIKTCDGMTPNTLHSGFSECRCDQQKYVFVTRWSLCSREPIHSDRGHFCLNFAPRKIVWFPLIFWCQHQSNLPIFELYIENTWEAVICTVCVHHKCPNSKFISAVMKRYVPNMEVLAGELISHLTYGHHMFIIIIISSNFNQSAITLVSESCQETAQSAVIQIF